jgi:uncharacterized membrane protein
MSMTEVICTNQQSCGLQSNQPTSVNLYPVITPAQEVQQMVESVVNDKNAQTVKVSVKTKSDQLIHYQKVLARWQKGKSISTNVLFILALIMQIVSIVMGFLIDYSILSNSFITEILDVISLGFLAPLGVILVVAFSRKITAFTTVCQDIKSCIDQVYVYWKQATVDSVITDDELTKFNSIFNNANQLITTDSNAPMINKQDLTNLENIFSQAFSALSSLVKK